MRRRFLFIHSQRTWLQVGVIGFSAQVKTIGLKLKKIGDRVFANQDSLVGNVGVLGFFPNFNKLFTEKTKIDRKVFTTSEKLLEHRFDILKKDYLTEDD